MASRDERDARAHFEERYAIEGAEVLARIERRVIGAAWGANGYTTLDQADELLRHLNLGPDSRLLDVGTGRGCPALYLAQRTGCAVIGTDLPMAALVRARTRAEREGLSERAALVVASAARLPFAGATFDAVVHTDVLC